jgi:hypothetical protein
MGKTNKKAKKVTTKKKKKGTSKKVTTTKTKSAKLVTKVVSKAINTKPVINEPVTINKDKASEKSIKPITELPVKPKNKSFHKLIAKNKKDKLKKYTDKLIRKIRMYGLKSVINKQYVLIGTFVIIALVTLSITLSLVNKQATTNQFANLPSKIDQLKTISFDINDVNEIVSSSNAYSGLKDYYEYDFNSMFGLAKETIAEYAIKYNKNNGQMFAVFKPTSGNEEAVDKAWEAFLQKSKITDYSYFEYQGYHFFIKSSDNVVVTSKVKQSQIRVFSILQELKQDDIENTFGIKESYYSYALVKTSMLISDTCEYIIFKPVNGNTKAKIKNAMNDYYETLESKWQDTNENNYNLVKNRYFEEYDGYLIYVVSYDNDLVMQLIKG